jgi:hypothetical protein
LGNIEEQIKQSLKNCAHFVSPFLSGPGARRARLAGLAGLPSRAREKRENGQESDCRRTLDLEKFMGEM